MNASVVRMPQVHDRDRHGLASYILPVARKAGVSSYIGDGRNRWPAVHRLDAAPIYRFALEHAEAGARYHAVAEEGVVFREIAKAIGRGLGTPVASLTPEEAAARFGWLTRPLGMDASASSKITRQRLGWHPANRAGLIADIEASSTINA